MNAAPANLPCDFNKEIEKYLSNNLKLEHSANAKRFVPKVAETIDKIASALIEEVKLSLTQKPECYAKVSQQKLFLDSAGASFLTKFLKNKLDLEIHVSEETDFDRCVAYKYANSLGTFLRVDNRFSITVIWYPEHPLIYKKKEPEFLPATTYGPAAHLKLEWKAAKKKMATDITFKVEDKEFGAHKIKLLCHSEHFTNMLNTAQSQEAQTGTIQIKECSSDTFRRVLKFLYTGSIGKKVKSDFQAVLNILQQGNRFQVKELVQECTATLHELMKSHSIDDAELLNLLEYSCQAREKGLAALCLSQLKNKKLVAKIATAENWPFLMEIAKEQKFDSVQTELTRCAEYNPNLFAFQPKETQPEPAAEMSVDPSHS